MSTDEVAAGLLAATLVEFAGDVCEVLEELLPSSGLCCGE